jgi:hypothetical protein
MLLKKVSGNYAVCAAQLLAGYLTVKPNMKYRESKMRQVVHMNFRTVVCFL